MLLNRNDWHKIVSKVVLCTLDPNNNKKYIFFSDIIKFLMKCRNYLPFCSQSSPKLHHNIYYWLLTWYIKYIRMLYIAGKDVEWSILRRRNTRVGQKQMDRQTDRQRVYKYYSWFIKLEPSCCKKRQIKSRARNWFGE